MFELTVSESMHSNSYYLISCITDTRPKDIA